jgi:hypothetical protein
MMTIYERSMLRAMTELIKLLVMLVRRAPGERVMDDENDAMLTARRLEDLARKG